jgi:hypothetical protein
MHELFDHCKPKIQKKAYTSFLKNKVVWIYIIKCNITLKLVFNKHSSSN